MGDCCKRLDGLTGGGGSVGGTSTGDVQGNLTVTGDIIVGPGPDGWGNVRSATAANGLDLEAPAGKKVRLVNGAKSWVEVDANEMDLNAPNIGHIGVRVPDLTTDYNLTLPINTGTATQVLTSDGTRATYWSTAAGTGGGGTVTSVDVQSLNTFLTTSGGPVTSAGVIGVNLSGSALPVANGGTGVSTSTGSGSVVLNTSPNLTGPVTVGGNLIVNGNETINSTTGDVFTVNTTMTSTSNLVKSFAPNLLAGNSVYTIFGRTESVNNAGYIGFQLVSAGLADNFLKFGLFVSTEVLTMAGTGQIVAKANIASTSITTGTVTTPGGVGIGGDLYVGKTINLAGSTSGNVKIQTQANAGVYNLNLPTSAGTNGQVLSSGGGGSAPMTWVSAATGSVTSIGMTVPAFLSVSPVKTTTKPTFALELSGSALPVLNGGTGSTTATGTGSNVLQFNPTLTGTTTVSSLLVQSTSTFSGTANFGSITASSGVSALNLTATGTITGGRLSCSATSTHSINLSSGTDVICNFFKQDLVQGQVTNILLGQNNTTNLHGSIGFKRDDAGNGSRFEFSFPGTSGVGVGIYKAFVNGPNWYEKTIVADGGIGCSGSIRANSFSTSGVEFGYDTGTPTPGLLAGNHFFTYYSRGSRYTKIGNQVTFSFFIEYDVNATAHNDELLMNLPLPVAVDAAAPLAKSTTLLGDYRQYFIQVFAGTQQAKFTTHTDTAFESFVRYAGNAYPDSYVAGTIVYHTN